ncbi:MAG: hypothetical protein AAB815_00885 [Patescibacteria group bacterium]
MGGDNGGASGGAGEPLTPEERSIKRQELWSSNPEDFIHISEIVIGTRVLSNGQLQCIVGMPNQLLLEMSCTRIQYEVNKLLTILEAEARRAAASKVMPAKGGVMDFVRRRR